MLTVKFLRRKVTEIETFTGIVSKSLHETGLKIAHVILMHLDAMQL